MEERMYAAGAPALVTVEQMAGEYLEVIRERQPHGPYALVGLSFGGVLAYEIARRLRAGGEEVAVLGLLDSFLPRGRRWSLRRWARAHLRPLLRLDWSPLRRVLGARVRRLFRARPRLAAPPAGPLPDDQLDALRLDLYARATAAYDRHIPPYEGQVLLFRAEARDEGARWRPAATSGWR